MGGWNLHEKFLIIRMDFKLAESKSNQESSTIKAKKKWEARNLRMAYNCKIW